MDTHNVKSILIFLLILKSLSGKQKVSVRFKVKLIIESQVSRYTTYNIKITNTIRRFLHFLITLQH